MSEKHLTEPPWKALVAKLKLKDPGLQKALAAYGKVDSEKDPAPAIEWLAEIADQAIKLKKANPTVKEATTYLDEVVKEAAKTKQALASKPKAEPEDEEESADIKVRLVNALKKVKAADGGGSLPFVACVAKPFYGILLGKSPSDKIGVTHKKLLTELTKGTKFIVGNCLFENNAHTFIADPVPTGLAKNLKKSLKEFTGLTCKVRVRDSEGKVIADGDTEADEGEAASPQAETGATAPAPTAAPTATGQATTGEDTAKFTARFKALQPEILKTIAAKTPQAEEIKRRAKEAGELAAKKDFPQANKELDGVETLLKQAATAPPPTGPKVATDPKATVAPEPAPEATAKPANKALDDANAAADETEKLLNALKKHLQAAQVLADISGAATELKKARDLIKAGKYPEATAALMEAKKKITAGKDVADKYATYAVKRATVAALLSVFRVNLVAGSAYLTARDGEMAAADVEAGPTKRDFVKATALVEKVRQKIATTVKTWYVDDPKPKIQAIKDKPAAAFVAEDIKEIESLQAGIVSDIGKDAYAVVILSGRRLGELIGIAGRLADRRKAFDDQRVLTRKAIDALKAHPSVALQMAELEKRLVGADALADRRQMRIEDGAEELKKIAADSARLLTAAPDADAYNTARTAAVDKLAKLTRHPAADRIGDALATIQQQLEQAFKLTGAGDWKGARALISQATADLDAAAKLADKAKETQDAAGTKGDAAAVKNAIAKLRKQAEALEKGDNGKLVKADLKQVSAALKQAEARASAKPPGNTGESLKQAADGLIKAEGVASLHTRFIERRKLVEDRYKALLKLPTAKANKAKIQAVEALLKTADGHDGKRDGTKATAAVEQADAAAKEAEKLDGLRQAFEARSKAVAKQLKEFDPKALDKKQRKEVEGDLKFADKQATDFQFDAANRVLDLAEARMEASKTHSLANQKPPDAALLADSAKKVMAKGGGRLLDAMVRELPDNVPFSVLAAMAKQRFGLELQSDAVDDTKSGKKIWEMLSKVPQDVVGNPSLKTVRRKGPTENGGLYQSDGNLIVMNGRPGQSKQGFGKGIANELPKDVEDDCQPVDDKPLDYFDFATLHEVGHSVDDSAQFMNSRAGQEKFGGWTQYGGKVEPIAAAVAKWAGYDSTPEQKKYVLDLIIGNATNPPTPPTDKQDAWKAAKKKVDDWHKIATSQKVWWSQANSGKITIDGVIYHEAYDNTWVSYLAKARQQAITGYQFRAPGEWFAELYASYRIGKLKKTHPAVKWLSAIKI